MEPQTSTLRNYITKELWHARFGLVVHAENASHVETEVDDISILHRVIPTFEPY